MKFTKSLILAGAAFAGLMSAQGAFAQSTATQAAEEKEGEVVVVKGSRKGASVINKETGAKQKSVVGQEFISTQSAGQTILETLNVVPGVNFTSNDPYGSSGGDIFIRGLDNSRISLTFDGVQLNDAGNYAIYSNQQLDPELIESASVITGATDADSMTASATGGTLNYTTRKTREEFGVMAQYSVGSFDYGRFFGLVDTGKFGPFGTQAWFSASTQGYDTFTKDTNINDEGKLKKVQYNFSVYQPVLDNGSFMSLSGHYNENRNHFIFGQSLSNFATRGKFYNSIGRANISPSNTGNLRFKSRWNISEALTVFADASYQYVLANGGGNSTVNETTGRINTWTYSSMAGVDHNGDGDTLDTSVPIYRPNTTHTDRYGSQLGALYRFNSAHSVRLGLSIDRARTRQTGEATLLDSNGAPLDVFGAKTERELALKTKNAGEIYQRRNRFSKANVDVLSLEYRGKFFNDVLGVVAGVRSQKMERELYQYCYSRDTGTGSFDPFCTNQAPTATNANGTVTFAGNTGNFIKPYVRTVSFDQVQPSLGLTYKLFDTHQAFFNYSENMSSPRTDSYYAVVIRNGALDVANPNPETVKNFEVGYRINASNMTASASVWKKDYADRIVSSYDTATDTFFDRNVGEVKMEGAEASIGYKFLENLSGFAGFTYTDTEVQGNIPNGEVATALGTDKVGDVLLVPTKGKKLVEVPDYMYNLGVNFDLNDKTHFSLIGKYVGERFVTDVNDLKAKSYTTWNFSARRDLQVLKAGSYLQLNIINLTDEYYFGNLGTVTASQNVNTPSGTRIINAGTPNFNVGAPRTVMLTLRTQF